MLKNIDKIYVLSASTSHDRRAIIQDYLTNMGLDFEFYISGPVPIFNLFYDVLKKEYKDHKNNQWLNSPNEIGATLAHLNVIQLAKANGYENILILEDDVIFHKDFVERFNESFPQISDNYNVAYLVNNNQHPEDLEDYNENWRVVKGATLACAYMINKRFYDHILKFYAHEYMVIDVFYFHNQYYNQYLSLKRPIVSPNPNIHSSITTNQIHLDYLDYDEFIF